MDAFSSYVLADVVGVVIALACYDWALDPFLEWLSKKARNGVLKDQGVS